MEFIVHLPARQFAHANLKTITPDNFHHPATHQQDLPLQPYPPGLRNWSPAEGIDNLRLEFFGTDVAIDFVFVDQLVEQRCSSPLTRTPAL